MWISQISFPVITNPFSSSLIGIQLNGPPLYTIFPYLKLIPIFQDILAFKVSAHVEIWGCQDTEDTKFGLIGMSWTVIKDGKWCYLHSTSYSGDWEYKIYWINKYGKPYFLFVFNIVKLIYVVNYHRCRYFHRNPIPAPTSWISF